MEWTTPAAGTVTQVTTTLGGISIATDTTTPSISGTLNGSSGGTGLSSAVILGDLLVGNTATAYKRLGVGGNGTTLLSNGTEPYWGTLLSGMTTDGGMFAAAKTFLGVGAGNYDPNLPIIYNLGVTAIGWRAVYSGSSAGADTTALGYQAGYASTGASNTFLGSNSGMSITNGANNTIVGRYTGAAAPVSITGSNYIVLSDGAGNIRSEEHTSELQSH